MSAGQTSLDAFAGPDLSALTETEREVYVAVERGDYGAREFQRERGWSSPGTVSNILRRARAKVEGGDAA
jgi:DNA-binding CsgD family transcriptional regulator